MRRCRTSQFDFVGGDDGPECGASNGHSFLGDRVQWPRGRRPRGGARRRRRFLAPPPRLSRHALATHLPRPRHAPGKPSARPSHAPATLQPCRRVPPSVRSVGSVKDRTGPRFSRACFDGPDRPFKLAGQDRAGPSRAGHEPDRRTGPCRPQLTARQQPWRKPTKLWRI